VEGAATEILAGIYEPDAKCRRPPESLYGTAKMWAYLSWQGIPVAKCTVERLKRAYGWRGQGPGSGCRAVVP
jgi:putative transposase